jgi:Domain of unknown function (DUF4844)
MSYDPLSEIEDHPISVSDEMLLKLTVFRAAEKFLSLPGENTDTERARLASHLNTLIDSLSEGISANSNKLWVMTQFQDALKKVEQEDTEAREHFGSALETVMDVLGVESSDGLLSFYLGGL